jgi:predicted flap endonuclease-1-like 5' DNA nuclease
MQPGSAVVKLTSCYGGQVYLYAQWGSAADQVVPSEPEESEFAIEDTETVAPEEPPLEEAQPAVTEEPSTEEDAEPVLPDEASQAAGQDSALPGTGSGDSSGASATDVGIWNFTQAAVYTEGEYSDVVWQLRTGLRQSRGRAGAYERRGRRLL